MTEKSDSVSVLETLCCAGKATARLVTKRRRENSKSRQGEENIGLLRSVSRSNVVEKKLDTKKQQQQHQQKKKKKKRRNDRWSSRYVDGGGVLLKFFLPVSLTRSPTRSPSSVPSRSPLHGSHREERTLVSPHSTVPDHCLINGETIVITEFPVFIMENWRDNFILSL